jgi:hypothetical protein
MGDARRVAVAVFPFPLMEAVTTRLLLKLYRPGSRARMARDRDGLGVTP